MNNAMLDDQEAIRDAVCQRRLRGSHITAYIGLMEIYEGTLFIDGLSNIALD